MTRSKTFADENMNIEQLTVRQNTESKVRRMSMPLQYIGLSGVDNRTSLATILQAASVHTNGTNMPRLVNNIYTAHAGPNIAIRGGNHKPDRDVPRNEIDAMITLENVSHFFHYSPMNAEDSLQGPLALWQMHGTISGFQISQARIGDKVEWPKFLKQLRTECNDCSVVLQLGSELVYGVRDEGVVIRGLADFRSGNLDPRLLCEWIQPFVEERAITHVLWDVSGGSGEGLDISVASQALLAVQSLFPEIGIAIAGGLSGDDVQPVAKMIEMGVQNLSVDAASGLRDQNTDVFSTDRAVGFVNEASRILDQSELHKT